MITSPRKATAISSSSTSQACACLPCRPPSRLVKTRSHRTALAGGGPLLVVRVAVHSASQTVRRRDLDIAHHYPLFSRLRNEFIPRCLGSCTPPSAHRDTADDLEERQLAKYCARLTALAIRLRLGRAASVSSGAGQTPASPRRKRACSDPWSALSRDRPNQACGRAPSHAKAEADEPY